jgi:hypothetical protein
VRIPAPDSWQCRDAASIACRHIDCTAHEMAASPIHGVGKLLGVLDPGAGPPVAPFVSWPCGRALRHSCCPVVNRLYCVLHNAAGMSGSLTGWAMQQELPVCKVLRILCCGVCCLLAALHHVNSSRYIRSIIMPELTSASTQGV